MPTKRIVCLANSRKHSGRCIAGREVGPAGPGGWVRPISDRPSHEVSEQERQYSDGSDPKVLDILDVPLVRAAPSVPQIENWILDPDWYWELYNRLPRAQLEQFVDSGPLWLNGYKTYWGLNDQVPLDEVGGLRDSLRLVMVDSLNLKVYAPGEDFGDPKRKVQAQFALEGEGYRLRVTDPIIEREYLAKPDGRYELGKCFLTVSLGEPWKDYFYKLVAAVIREPNDAE